MTVKEAIARADALRPNTFGEEQKAAWVLDLEGQLAEMFGVEPPRADEWPERDTVLMVPHPHDEIYQLLLICRIDYYNQDMALYANDQAFYTAALKELKAWFRRTHRPEDTGRNWRVM